MKNLKKIVLGLMLLLAVFAFVGCPTPEQPAPTPTPEQPAGGNEGTEQKPSTGGNGGKEETPPAGGNGGEEQKPSAGGNGGEEQKPSTGGNGEEEDKPVVVENKFKGNIFEGSCNTPFGCIYNAFEFESETVGNKYTIEMDEDFNEYIKKSPFTYTVKDDVATITFTDEDDSTGTVTTSKIENDSFSFEVTEEGMTFNFSCKKSDKSILEEWTMYFLGVEDDTEYFLNILGMIADYQLVENTDYTLDKTNKIINITESGLIKLEGGDEEGDQPADGEYIVMYNGEIFESFSTLEEFEAFLSSLSLFDSETDSGDYNIFDDFTVVLTDEGYAKFTGNGDDEEEYIVMYGDETLGTVSSEELEAFLSYLEKSDYSKDDFTVVLTDTEYEKFKEDWKVIFPGNQTSLSYDLIIDQLYKYGLEENTHYAVDLVNRTVTVNDEGFAIMTAPFWKIVNMEGLLQSQAPEFYVRVQIEEAGLKEGEHYTVNYDEYTFKLTETGSEKWNEYSNS